MSINNNNIFLIINLYITCNELNYNYKFNQKHRKKCTRCYLPIIIQRTRSVLRSQRMPARDTTLTNSNEGVTNE